MDIIIGAGISGLSYAAVTTNDYLILESDSQIGGYCRTIKQNGFIWDYSGHFFHFQHPEIKDYVMREIAEEDMLSVRKYTQILYRNRLVDYPFQMNIHQLEKDEFIDCLYDLFTVVSDKNIESFKQMLYAKFGKSIAEKFLIPYNTKLYATDLDKLDVDAMGRFFPHANKEQIIRNFRNPANASYNATFLYPKDGCMRIIDSMCSHVQKSSISLNEAVVYIDRKRHEVVTTKRTLKYDNLISTMPLTKLFDISGVEYDREVYSWNKVLVFNLGFDSKGPEKKNNWIYVPEEKYCFYRVGFYDNILGQNRTSMYVEIGYGKDEDVGDVHEMLQRTLKDLVLAGFITEQQELVSYHYVVMDPAYVHITRGSETDKAEKLGILRNDNIYSIGRYGAWKYCSLEDNIFDAFELAQTI